MARGLPHGKALLGNGQHYLLPVEGLMAKARELAIEMAADFRLMMRHVVTLIP